MKIDIPPKVLKAVSLAAAKQDIRYYLNGVLIQIRPDGVFLVATDGSRMHVALLKDRIQDAPMLDLIIPDTVVANALKVSAGPLALKKTDGSWSLGLIQFEPIQGAFPDWRRVVPVIQTPEPAPPLRGEYVSDLARAAALLGGKSAGFHLHAQGGAVLAKVNEYENFFAVLMSLRATKKIQENPLDSWHTAASAARPFWSN